MKPCNCFIEIEPADIDLSDQRFRISAREEDLSSLAQSVKKFGLLTPPVVWPIPDSAKQKAAYIPVAGFRRLLVVSDLSGFKKICCLVMKGAAEKDCAIRAVADNAFQRELTTAELIRSLKLLERFLAVDEIAADSVALFNREMNPRFIKDLLSVADLPSIAMTLLESSQLALKPAKRMTNLDPGMNRALLEIFSRIKVSSGKQLDIITSFFEICARENISPKALAGEAGLADILARETRDLGQKGNQVRQYLVQRRYPHLEQARQKAKQQVNRLKLGKQVRFTLPDNFESDIYGLSLEFRSPDEFRQRLAELETLAVRPDFEAILER